MAKKPNVAAKKPASPIEGEPGKFEASNRVYYERIGDREFELEEKQLHVDDDVALWQDNPRVRAQLGSAAAHSEEEIAAKLRAVNDYDGLRRSIQNQGQLTPVYAWKKPGRPKYLVIEGNTRVTALRELRLKNTGRASEAQYTHVSAKILPESLTEEDIVVLLVGIHVRGSGVREWSRYTQAAYVYNAVNQQAGKRAVTTMKKLAGHMGRSESWVSRLVSAYGFVLKYVEHFNDTSEAQVEAMERFSILEEICKSATFGAKVRDYENAEYDRLRREVFEMVHHGVFSEYRDARHIQAFHDDAEKWARLMTLEKDIGKSLAQEVSSQTSSLSGRIVGLPDSIRKTLVAKPDSLSEEHLEPLHEAAQVLSSFLSGSSAFVLQMNLFKKSLAKATMEEIEQVSASEFDEVISRIQRMRGFVKSAASQSANA